MFSNAAKIIQTSVMIAAVSTAVLAPSTASAGLLGDIEHDAKSVGKVVAHPGKLAKEVGHVAESASRDITHPKMLVKDTVHAVEEIKVKKVLKTVGNAVGDVYSTAAKVSADIPVAKDFRPLMRDVARAARSSEGETAAAVGVGLAVVTGGASYAASQGGGWGYAAFAGKRAAKQIKTEVNTQLNSLRQ